MSKRKLFIFSALVVLIVLAVILSRTLAQQRRNGLPDAYAGYTATEPPALTFILAGLGCARGIASEILWFRANRLQDEGRYMELVQISDWIARLDPRAADAWIYNAWNLAYNISSLLDNHEERLTWVQNGFSLLQNDALRYNPRSARIYRELAWMYLNKIGDNLDAAHLTYKIDLAKKMAEMVDGNGHIKENVQTRSKLHEIGLDFGFIQAIEKSCGKLDWRAAESHALYWAMRGRPYATGLEEMQIQRVIYQALLLGFIRGKIVSVSPWRQDMNKELAAATEKEIKRMLDKFPSKDVKRLYNRFRARYSSESATAPKSHDRP